MNHDQPWSSSWNTDVTTQMPILCSVALKWIGRIIRDVISDVIGFIRPVLLKCTQSDFKFNHVIFTFVPIYFMYNFLSKMTLFDLFRLPDLTIKMSDTAEVVDLASKTVTELKAECKARNLPVSGKKSELISRFATLLRRVWPCDDLCILGLRIIWLRMRVLKSQRMIF